jgi:hemoglobin
MNSSPTSLSLRSFCRTTVTALALFAPLSLPVLAAPDPAPVASTPSAPLAPCPVSGKPANPTITTEYEGKTYAFADEACRKTFIQARENSLYHKLGGRAAIEAAVELFYTKVLADQRINHFFADINMNKQRRKQKEFLSAAFGGPVPYSGKDLRKAHAHLPQLNDSHFDAVAENLQKTLEELKVPGALISQVMEIAASTRNAVLNRPESTTK